MTVRVEQAQQGWDPLELVYEGADSAEAEVPFKALVLGRFLPEGAEPWTEILDLNRRNFESVMQGADLRLELELADWLAGEPQASRWIHLQLGSLADFHPDRLLTAVPDLAAALDLRHKLQAARREGASALDDAALSAEQQRLLASLAPDSGAALDWTLATASLHERLVNQLDAVLHHPELQALESQWRGLWLMVREIAPEANCRMDVIHVDFDALREDLEGNSDLTSSYLYDRLYVNEFGQYGGQPYGVVIAPFEIGPGANELAVLRGAAEIAASCHAPLLAGASPRLFGLESHRELPNLGALGELMERPAAARWRAFQREPVARYVGLLLPRIALREPYDDRRGHLERLAYREHVSPSGEERLWGSPALAYAGCLFRSFRRYRSCVDIVGPEGGWVAAAAAGGGRSGGLAPEAAISEQRERALADLGFIPLALSKAQGALIAYAANSAYWPSVGRQAAPSREAAVSEHLGAQLPYLFIVCRIAHYLKVIQRDNIGTMKTRIELENGLRHWLHRYVADVENPAPELRNRRPIKQASVTIGEPEDGAGWFPMHLSVVPHMKYMDAHFTLSLNAWLGQN